MGAMSCLLDQARRGEAEALSALYRRVLPGIFGYIAARVPDRATTEDLTLEVFLTMVEGIGQLRASDEAGFAGWLLQIAHLTVAAYYRKREHLPALVSLDPGDQEEAASGNSYDVATVARMIGKKANAVKALQ